MTKEEEMIEAVDAAEPQSAKDKVTNHFLHKGYNGLLILGRLFRRADNDYSGTLSLDEIKQLFNEDGLELSDEEYTELFHDYDSDGEGTINYEEFLSTVRPEMSQDRIDIVKEAFDKLNTSGDDSFSVDDAKEKYSAANHPSVLDGSETEEQVFNRWISRFEGNTTTDGKVTLNEFLDYYAVISKSIDDDAYFIEMMKLCWGL